MKRSTTAVALAMLTFAPSLRAHGGQYRGPGNVVPPPTGSGTSAPANTNTNSSAGGSGVAPAPAAPSGPRPSGAAIGPSQTGRAAARGMALDDDLGRWEFWWEFGKDPFLRLRDAIYSDRTPDDDVLAAQRFAMVRRTVDRPRTEDLDTVAGALALCLEKATSRDLVSGCVVALAKIAREARAGQLTDAFTPLLRVGDQELRETAALALGISGIASPAHIAILSSLVRDDAEARARSGNTNVNERTRAFAAYGLGLLLARADNDAIVQQLCEPLLEIVRTPQHYGRELQVAAIEALAQLRPTLDTAAARRQRAQVVDALGTYYDREAGAGDRLLQAHVPPAIARLLPRSERAAEIWKDRLLADLRVGVAATNNSAARGGNLFLAQSCALALGHLAGPWNADNEGDGAVGAALLEVYKEHRDQQTRSFALLAIARLGGDRARAVLLRELTLGGKAIEQPWCAMALGVLNARQVEQAIADGRPPENDREISAALAKAFAGAHNPSTQGALAVALGLSGDDDAREKLRAALLENRQKDDVAGYTALALGLLRDQRAVGDVRTLLQESGRRPFVMMQCTRALGLIGDSGVTDLLCAQIEAPDAGLVRLAAASAALGQIGDRRSIEPLLRMLRNEKLSDLSRAFAAVALGGVCDKDPIPWNSAYASYTNYRAATETLTDGQRGILDIL